MWCDNRRKFVWLMDAVSWQPLFTQIFTAGNPNPESESLSIDGFHLNTRVLDKNIKTFQVSQGMLLTAQL